MLKESRSLGLERKYGGKLHLKLNMSSRPIANKYHEGKVKRPLKRELKVPAIAQREANGGMLLLLLLVQAKRARPMPGEVSQASQGHVHTTPCASGTVTLQNNFRELHSGKNMIYKFVF